MGRSRSLPMVLRKSRCLEFAPAEVQEFHLRLATCRAFEPCAEVAIEALSGAAVQAGGEAAAAAGPSATKFGPFSEHALIRPLAQEAAAQAAGAPSLGIDATGSTCRGPPASHARVLRPRPQGHIAMAAAASAEALVSSGGLKSRRKRPVTAAAAATAAIRGSTKLRKEQRCTLLTAPAGLPTSRPDADFQAKPDRCPSPTAQGDIAILRQDFYCRDAVDLAPCLLGKLLRRGSVVLRITEVEAYRPDDTACHARFGLTKRTAPLFGEAGRAYVYLCYGLHQMLNVVCDAPGTGAAVLIRACEPVLGLEAIKQRRGLHTDKPILLTGPGKVNTPAMLHCNVEFHTVLCCNHCRQVGAALGLSADWSNHPLYTPGGLELCDGPPPPTGILSGPRVGISYAQPHDVAACWRFAAADCEWVSQPRATLLPHDSFSTREADVTSVPI
eukprot:SM000082S22834  [mRNA]  locus=s82:276951:279676:+ [translate_table: standard]